MSLLGAHPRLSAMMLAADDGALAARACDIAALLEARDPLRGGPDMPADIMMRLDAIAGTSAAGGDDIDRAATIYVCLGVTSHYDGALSGAVFSDTNVVGWGGSKGSHGSLTGGGDSSGGCKGGASGGAAARRAARALVSTRLSSIEQ
jgi:hypothetical protein